MSREVRDRPLCQTESTVLRSCAAVVTASSLLLPAHTRHLPLHLTALLSQGKLRGASDPCY